MLSGFLFTISWSLKNDFTIKHLLRNIRNTLLISENIFVL